MPDTSKWTQADVDRHNAKINLTGKGIRQTLSTTDDAPPPKLPKYRNKKTFCGGILFDSGHEADRYLQLLAMQELGEISNLELQPQYGIFACEIASGRGIQVASFKADFRYFDIKENRLRIEDAKSEVTKAETAYSLRKKLVEACHGITIEEV